MRNGSSSKNSHIQALRSAGQALIQFADAYEILSASDDPMVSAFIDQAINLLTQPLSQQVSSISSVSSSVESLSDKDLIPISTSSTPKSYQGKTSHLKKAHPARYEYSRTFEEAWRIRPKRDASDPKAPAYSEWLARLNEGYSEKFLLEKLKFYAVYCKEMGRVGTRWVKRVSTFYNSEKSFLLDWERMTKERSIHPIMFENNEVEPEVVESLSLADVAHLHSPISQTSGKVESDEKEPVNFDARIASARSAQLTARTKQNTC